jgi:hypothetical protein
MEPSKNEKGLWQVEIDGKTYEFQKWGAKESFLTLVKIGKLIGKPAGELVAAIAGNGGLDTDIPAMPEMISKAAASLFDGLDEKETFSIVESLSAGNRVLCDGALVKFDTHYQDDLAHMFRVAKAGLEVQYGSFFGALRGLAGVVPKAAQEG